MTNREAFYETIRTIYEAAVASAASRLSATAAGHDCLSARTLYIDRDSGSPPIALEIAALRDGYAEIDPGLNAALVTMIDTGRCQEIRLDLFARIHVLTVAETDVCRLLFEGLRDEEIAEARRVRSSTIKSQMKSIRSKCRTSSRVELVRLALQTSPPVPADRRVQGDHEDVDDLVATIGGLAPRTVELDEVVGEAAEQGTGHG